MRRATPAWKLPQAPSRNRPHRAKRTNPNMQTPPRFSEVRRRAQSEVFRSIPKNRRAKGHRPRGRNRPWNRKTRKSPKPRKQVPRRHGRPTSRRRRTPPSDGLRTSARTTPVGLPKPRRARPFFSRNRRRLQPKFSPRRSSDKIRDTHPPALKSFRNRAERKKSRRKTARQARVFRKPPKAFPLRENRAKRP